MSIDKQTVFEKTPKGINESRSRWGIFADRRQKILALIDGKTMVEDLIATSGMKENKVLQELEGLLQERLIRESYTPSAQFTINAPHHSPQGIYVTVANTQAFMDALEKQKLPETENIEEELISLADIEEKLQREAEQLATREEVARQFQVEARVKEEAERIAREEAKLTAKESAERAALEKTERMAREETERAAREEGERKAREERIAKRLKAREEEAHHAREQAKRKAQEDAERVAREEAERRAREEAERIAREEAERMAREEAARRAREEAERLAREEAERIAREETERMAREEAARRAREEAERLAREEAERVAREEAERMAREEAARRAREEAERLAREEAERIAREETERMAREEAARRAREEAERLAREEAERVAREEAERMAREEAARRAREEAERLAREETERVAREEAERMAREEAARRAREEAERLAREEAERVAREEAERMEREEAARRAREEAERLAREETERIAREEAERMAREEAARRAREEAERLAREEAERVAREETERRAREEAERKAQEKAARKAREAAEKIARKEAMLSAREESGPGDRMERLLTRVKWATAGVVALLVLAAVGINFVPLGSSRNQLEKLASMELGETVKIQSMHVVLFPSPHLKLDRIRIGSQGESRIAVATIHAGWGTLLGSGRKVERIELEEVDLAPGMLEVVAGWPARNAQQQPAYHIASVTVRKLKIPASDPALPAFRGEFDFSGSGRLDKGWMGSEDGRLRADFAPAPDGLGVSVSASEVAPLYFLPVKISSLRATAKAGDRTIRFDDLNGSVSGGKVSGSLTLSWASGWSVAGNARIVGANVAASSAKPESPAVSGKLDAAFSFSQQAKIPEQLLRQPLLTGSVTLRDGAVTGFDLAETLHYAVEAIYIGQTPYAEWSFRLEPSGDEQAYKAMRMTGKGLLLEGSGEVSAQGALSGAVRLKVEEKKTSVRGNYKLGGSLSRPTILKN